jgi:hypothetical protein
MSNWSMRVLTLVALSSIAWVWAVTPGAASVTWTAPATYVDGTPLPVGDIDHYTVSWTPVGNTAGALSVKTLAASVPIVCGTVQISVTVTTSATAVYPNTTSTPAGPVPFVSGIACAPNPPGALAVQ